jgi:hypothetical protein
MRVGDQGHVPVALAPENILFLLKSCASGPVWSGAEIFTPNGIRSPERPARSMSRYRRYTGSINRTVFVHIHHIYVFNDTIDKSGCITSRDGLTVNDKFKNT